MSTTEGLAETRVPEFSDEYYGPGEFGTIEPGVYEASVSEITRHSEKSHNATFDLGENGSIWNTYLSTTPFYRGPGRKKLTKEERATKSKNTSTMFDWLRAAGYAEKFSDFVALEPDEVDDLVIEFIDVPVRVRADIRAYCKGCATEVFKRASEFPKNGSEEISLKPPCPGCGAELVARAYIAQVFATK